MAVSSGTRHGAAPPWTRLPAIAAYYAQALAQGYENTVRYRKSGALPDDQVVDLYFQDFIQHPVGSVRRAYRHFGLELSDAAATAMQSFLDENPADKHGRHLYRFADIGMDQHEARKLFRGYQQYFDIPDEPV